MKIISKTSVFLFFLKKNKKKNKHLEDVSSSSFVSILFSLSLNSPLCFVPCTFLHQLSEQQPCLLVFFKPKAVFEMRNQTRPPWISSFPSLLLNQTREFHWNSFPFLHILPFPTYKTYKSCSLDGHRIKLDIELEIEWKAGWYVIEFSVFVRS